MSSNGGKSRAYDRHELPGYKKEQNKYEKFLVLSCSKYDSGFVRFLYIFTDSCMWQPYVYVEA